MTPGLTVRNARVWTGVSHTDGFAVEGGRIAGEAAGGTRVLDAGGRRILPGFNDAHLHLLMGGLQLEQLDLKDAATPAEFKRRVQEQAARLSPGEWLLGGNWDEQQWPAAELPVRAWVDDIPTPLFLRRYDVHAAFVNTAALALAGIDASTPDPPGGEIVRDRHGQPTGVLKDAAMELVSRAIPPISPGQRRRAVRRAFEHAAQLGVTSLQDMGTEPGTIGLLDELRGEDALTARVRTVLPIGSVNDRPAAYKAFVDGSLGSHTALFFEDYSDKRGWRGLLAPDMLPAGRMEDRMARVSGAGAQICIHAIGDRAVSMALDLHRDFPSRRPRIEHAQHLAPGDFERFAQLGAIASVQPYHAIDDGRWAESRIADRARRAFAFRSLLDAGVKLALGTDWPVAPLDPLLTVYAAVTRATLDGLNPGGWIPEQRLTVEEALSAYTSGSAFAEFQEEGKGTLLPGHVADFAILSEDPFTVAPRRLRDIRVEATFVAGRQVWPRE